MFLPYSNTELWLIIVITHLVRYFLFAGITFLIYYVFRKKRFSYSKIQAKFPKKSDYYREMGYSLLTFMIFGLVGVSIYNPSIRPYTCTYYNIADYGLPYLYISFFLMLLIHDTYFYWMHRLMHHPKLFRYFHKIHHQSTNPSPWAAFSFQPVEAFVEAGIFVIFAFTIPLHIYTIISFFVFMTAYNVYGHLGWELYPKRFSKNIIGKWINTSVSHNLHHHYFKDNYGLYFTFWDKIMKTMSPNYDEVFEEVKNRKIF